MSARDGLSERFTGNLPGATPGVAAVPGRGAGLRDESLINFIEPEQLIRVQVNAGCSR